MSVLEQDDSHYKGAHRVLTECIPLLPGERLALFYDDKTRAFASILATVAQRLNIVVAKRYVCATDQVNLSKLDQLAEEDNDAIDDSRAVIISLGSVDGGLSYRRRLLDRAVDDSRFVGLVPNATPELLSYGVDIDYAKVESRCDDLAVALMAGDHAEVITGHPRDGSRREKLDIFLGKFDRAPITSTGIIQRGAWGNVPGGETFIAPIEGSAKGKFVLNGAFKGHVIDPDNPLVLTFEAGELVRVDGPLDKRDPFLRLLHWAPNEMTSSLQLAELGIGVNEGLFEPTGNGLFDEKMHGTIHVAVGDNQMYGGTLKSFLHEDFISRKPTLIVDSLPILMHGEFVLDSAQWRESYDSIANRGNHLPQAFEVARSGVHAHNLPTGSFRVHRDVGSQRKCTYTVGDREVSPLLCQLWNLIPSPPESVSISVLQERWRASSTLVGPDTLYGLIAILQDHRVIECLQPDESPNEEVSWHTTE